MPSIAEYQGRAVDLAAFQVVLPGPTRRLLAQELVGTAHGGTLVAGLQKLAQRVLLVLLTKAGSHPFRPDYGTDFMADAEVGAWRTSADVEQSFYSARTDLRRQLQAEEDDAWFDDERYGTLDLVSVTLAGDKVTLGLQVTSLAGASAVYLTPITVPLQ